MKASRRPFHHPVHVLPSQISGPLAFHWVHYSLIRLHHLFQISKFIYLLETVHVFEQKACRKILIEINTDIPQPGSTILRVPIKSLRTASTVPSSISKPIGSITVHGLLAADMTMDKSPDRALWREVSISLPSSLKSSWEQVSYAWETCMKAWLECRKLCGTKSFNLASRYSQPLISRCHAGIHFPYSHNTDPASR